MQRKVIMVAGLPGNMATLVAKRVANTPEYVLAPISLTGSEVLNPKSEVEDTWVTLIRPYERGVFSESCGFHGVASAIDFTHPSAVMDNVKLYCDHNIPFVMGTTGGDELEIRRRVEESGIVAVYSPNMAYPIVALMSIFEEGASRFPSLFDGWTLAVVESHQAIKVDVSGTALKFGSILSRLGAIFSRDKIRMIRDRSDQLAMGVPEDHLLGHGWHAYELVSPDGMTKIGISHDINGRSIYVEGATLALDFLQRQILKGEKGQLYTMADVISG